MRKSKGAPTQEGVLAKLVPEPMAMVEDLVREENNESISRWVVLEREAVEEK